MNKNQIIIVTQDFDFHADAAIIMLREKGYEPIRLHTADIPIGSFIKVALYDSTWTGDIEVNGRVLDFSNIRSIWWRRPASYQLPSELSKREMVFSREEIQHALEGLWASLDCYWMSFPDSIRSASWKPNQLKRAAQLGFSVPRTLITTVPEQVQDFYKECNGNIIYKVMSDPSLAQPPIPSDSADDIKPLAVFTTPVGNEELSMLDSVRIVPCQFQEYIPKKLELRVTVIGDEVFPVEIHSQSHKTTNIDWRRYDVDIPYQKAILPDEITERCLALVRSYNLNFSAIDLILTPDEQYVFLENNPSGQFLWLEQRLPELKLLDALTSCLIRGSNN